jgi:nicotinate-nucleotide adenylyltransferase
VIDRPGSTLKSNASRAAQYFRQRRLDESDARLLVASPPPAWIFLHGRRSGLSSSAIRKGDALS